MSQVINHTVIPTPLGNLIACATQKGVCLLEFPDMKHFDSIIEQVERALRAKLSHEESNHKHFELLRKELALYFERKLQNFTVPLDMIGTDFQLAVWRELLKIPYGSTWSYLQQSIALGNAKALRAVANANSRNKISIIVPCHRVIGSNGLLTGYAGGLHRKKYLLELESGDAQLFE